MPCLHLRKKGDNPLWRCSALFAVRKKWIIHCGCVVPCLHAVGGELRDNPLWQCSALFAVGKELRDNPSVTETIRAPGLV